MNGRAEVILLHPDVDVQDIARALRKSGLGISNDPLDASLFIIAPLLQRFPSEPNVIDLAVPQLLRRQAGPERDIKGIDFDVVHNGRDFDVIHGPGDAA